MLSKSSGFYITYKNTQSIKPKTNIVGSDVGLRRLQHLRRKALCDAS